MTDGKPKHKVICALCGRIGMYPGWRFRVTEQAGRWGDWKYQPEIGQQSMDPSTVRELPAGSIICWHHQRF